MSFTCIYMPIHAKAPKKYAKTNFLNVKSSFILFFQMYTYRDIETDMFGEMNAQNSNTFYLIYKFVKTIEYKIMIRLRG